MSARRTIFLGGLGILFLGAVLVWLRLPQPEAAFVPSTARVAGLAVSTYEGVDHLTERFTGPAGYFSLEDQLGALGVTLYPEDHYTAIPDPAFGIGSAIEIIRATEVTILDAGQTFERRTWAPTVAKLLEETGIALDSDDRIEPGIDSPLAAEFVVTITRVASSEAMETEDIPFKTVTKADPDLEKGKTRVAEAGRAGLKKRTYSVTEENGAVVDRRLVKTEVVREPSDRVVYEGTKTIVYGTGQATWYALKTGMGAAHNTLPKGTRVKVTNVANGKSVDVVINDHGIQGSAIIDLTADAFQLIAPLGAGRIQVKIEKDYD